MVCLSLVLASVLSHSLYLSVYLSLSPSETELSLLSQEWPGTHSVVPDSLELQNYVPPAGLNLIAMPALAF